MINPAHSNPTALPWPRWLAAVAQALWPARATPQTADAQAVAAAKPVLLMLRELLPSDQPTVVCLAVEGVLNHRTYMYLIETARTHYQQGRRCLLLDLRQTSQIELSGLFALLSIARLYGGQPLLDPEAGWAGLHTAAEEITPALGERVKLVAPSPAALAALEQASFCRFFTCYPDLDTAIRAMSQ